MGRAWVQMSHSAFTFFSWTINYAFGGQGDSEWHVQLELLNFPTHFLWFLGSIPTTSRTGTLSSRHSELFYLNIYWAFGVSRLPTLSLGSLSGKLLVVRGHKWPVAPNSLTSILRQNQTKPKMYDLKCSFGISKHMNKRMRYLFRWILFKDWEMMGE